MRRRFVLAVVTLVCALAVAPSAVGAPSELFVSEYIEGTSNNKALEIFNGTGAAIDLAAGNYSIQMFFNGSSMVGLTIPLTGTIAGGDVYVVAQASANATILAQADQTNGAGWFNGDDAVALVKAGTIVDVIGQVGSDPGTEWGTGVTSTADNTLRRKATITAGDTTGTDAFDPSVEWDGFAADTFDGLGSHTLGSTDTAPSVLGTVPASGATNAAPTGNISITFTEDVDVSGTWFSISCSSSGPHTASVAGGPRTYTLDPDTDFVDGDACTVTVVAAQVTDQDANDPPDAMGADATFGFTVA